MNKKILAIILAVAAILIVFLFYPTGKEANLNEESEKPGDRLTILINDGGFNPVELSIKKGETVTFSNVGENEHWPASAIHPTHQVYPEFDPKEAIAPGDSWSFKFDKEGAWRFHDHIFLNLTGVITVR